MLAPPLLAPLLGLSSLSSQRAGNVNNAEADPIWAPAVFIDGTEVKGQYHPVWSGNTTTTTTAAEIQDPKVGT